LLVCIRLASISFAIGNPLISQTHLGLWLEWFIFSIPTNAWNSAKKKKKGFLALFLWVTLVFAKQNCYLITHAIYNSWFHWYEEEFEDTKEVIRICISKNNGQHNGQKKKENQRICTLCIQEEFDDTKRFLVAFMLLCLLF